MARNKGPAIERKAPKKKEKTKQEEKLKKTKYVAEIRKDMDERRENVGFLLGSNRDIDHYEKKIKPDLQLFLWNDWDQYNKDPIHEGIVKDLDFSVKNLGGGAFGEVQLVNKKGWRAPVAVKRQKCGREFKKELELLRKMNQLSKNIPFMGRLFDAYSYIAKKCVLVLPVADGSLDKMPKDLLEENMHSILMQGITGVFFFHTYLDSHHCDAHNGNWFYFKTKFKGLKTQGFTIPAAPVMLALFDPGLGIAVTDRNYSRNSSRSATNSDECTSPMYDYFRFFSSHAGLLRYTDSDAVSACAVYFSHYNSYLAKKYEDSKVYHKMSHKVDWDLRFPVVKSRTVWKDLMTVVSKKMTVDEVREKWPPMKK